jgi:hypothetical protein
VHPKKVLPKKPNFLGLFIKVICTFLKSVRKDGFFDARFDLFKEKKFSSLRRDNELFWSLMWIRDPESFDPGSGIPDGKIRIRDKHPGSATLAKYCSWPIVLGSGC